MNRVVLVVLLAAFSGAGSRGRAPTQADAGITGTSIARIRVCQPLDSVSVLYPDARDTMLFGGASQTRWPGKVVSLGPGEHLFAEASWVDESRVWRISTNSPAFATVNGLHVGSPISDVLAMRERATFTFPNGYLVVHLPRTRIAFDVDDSSAARFYRTWGGRGNPLRVLDRSATIKDIFVSGGCRRGRVGH